MKNKNKYKNATKSNLLGKKKHLRATSSCLLVPVEVGGWLEHAAEPELDTHTVLCIFV